MKTRLERFKDVCKKYLIISDTTYIDVIFGTIFANRRDSDPVWLYLVGAPSSGKTVILQALANADEIILRDTVTRPALISGYIEKKGKKTDPSLIPLLDGKNLIIKDFTTMLQMNYKELSVTLGFLRAAYDGRCSWSFGANQSKEYFSKFGLIAAVTNILDQHRGILADLGERFITYRLPEVSDYEKERRALKAMSCSSTSEQRQELSASAVAVLSSSPKEPELTRQQMRSITEVVQVVAKARTEVVRDKFSKSKEPEIPISEHPARMAKELGDLAIGIAMARGKRHITGSEIKLIRQIALHSVTLKRMRLFHVLLNEHPDWLTIEDVSDIMGFSGTSVSIWFQDLLLLNLIERRIIYRGKNLKRTQQFRMLKSQMLKRVLSI